MQAALGLVGVSLAYSIYMIYARLGRRIRLDGIVLRDLAGGRQSKLNAVRIILNWIFFVTMLVLIVSGAMLYFGVYAGHEVAMLHWYGTWITVAFSGLHLVTHHGIGGTSQLLRIFRPGHLPEPSPQLDAIELLTLLVEKSAQLAPDFEAADAARPYRDKADMRRPDYHLQPDGSAARRHFEAEAPNIVPKPRDPTFHSNPFAVALAVAVAGTSLLVMGDRLTVDSLQVHRISVADAPTLDGDTSDRAWRNVEPFSVMTSQGGNFDGKGETRIDIRAVHDGTWAYFLFTWDDPTRSLKQLPLIKQPDGWHLLQRGHEAGDEHEYSEDKFSVLLTTSDSILAGDRTFHAGLHPLPGAPPSTTGRGLHFTAADGGYVDVWQWKATSGGPTGWMDDEHFGPPLQPTPMQMSNVVPYRGGFAPDPGTANYSENFVIDGNPGGNSNGTITPRRLPTDLAATVAAMGKIDLDPEHGESDGARWFMTEAESTPYSAEGDSRIPTGTVLPGIIIAGDFLGDRADIRAMARWASGHWALEVARRLDTGSQYDVPIKTGVFMRVAAFDHSQIRHTRHTRPIRIEVE
jgi:hypothetical protein